MRLSLFVKSLPDLALVLPFFSVAYVFIYRNWLNSEACIQNIVHYYYTSIPLVKTDVWAEPFTMCLDPYWVNQWLKNYGAGFAKRGFIGEIATHLFDGQINLLVLNSIGFLVILCIAYGIVFLLVNISCCKSKVEAALFVALIWLTPFGKSLVETAADPLQIIILLMIGMALMASKFRLKGLKLDAALISLYIVSILIHEGAFLLLLPAVIIIGRRTWLWWLGIVASIVIIILFSGADNMDLQDLIANRLTGINPHNNFELSYRAGGNLASQVSFSYNVKQEFTRYIKDPAEIFGQFSRTFMLVFYLALCLSLWIQGFSGSASKKFLKIWLLFFFVTLPFFLIAHDWVRYGIINLVSCLCCVAMNQNYHLEQGISQDSELTKERAVEIFTINSPWISMVLMFFLIGPHLNQADIRTFPPQVLGLKYTYLAVLTALTFTCNWRKRLAK